MIELTDKELRQRASQLTLEVLLLKPGFYLEFYLPSHKTVNDPSHYLVYKCYKRKRAKNSYECIASNIAELSDLRYIKQVNKAKQAEIRVNPINAILPFSNLQ